MNLDVHYFDVKDRLDEARALAARERLLAALRPQKAPLRVLMGMALIRAGRWMAGPAARRGAQPRRATA